MFNLIVACFGNNQRNVFVEDGRALVTGGAQGIGRAVCEALLSRGCKVCCVDVNGEKGQQTVEELQKTYGESNCTFAKCDVSSSEEFENAYLKAKHSFGTLNILINNAGVADDRAVDVNLKGVINGCNIALKYMGKNNGGNGGSVVNVGSIAGIYRFTSSHVMNVCKLIQIYCLALQILPFYGVYAATKAGVVTLTRCHGLNYENSGIKFTCLCPNTVNTELYRNIDTTLDIKIEEMKKNNPPLEPSEVAEAIIQLMEEGKPGAVMTVVKGEKNKYVKFSTKIYLKLN
ncbi:15-hydroxyprostaglandin dehydrogenase [NAD(+)]-like isoform X1 [Centruroides vittatus]|uniref:15-hydroxyprostaglandin dehydrogenase [NAD(+)]-like isoform X1 n=1 Tax=Centruroides vittatus TaxID=120091 RepID=UPI0035101511